MTADPEMDGAEEFAEDVTVVIVEEPEGPGLVARFAAEAFGTFVLVLLGVGAALFGSYGNNGTLTVGLAFGAAVVIAATAIGSVSGAHLNPAITLGVWLSGRMRAIDVAFYVIAQVLGALIAGLVLFGAVWSIQDVTAEVTRGFMATAANGWGDYAPLAASGLTFGPWVAFVVEVVATGLLVAAALGATKLSSHPAAAPFVIGIALAFLLVLTIPFTNGALNPARATATAVFGEAGNAAQLWMFWLAPLVGGAIAGLMFRLFGPDEDMLDWSE